MCVRPFGLLPFVRILQCRPMVNTQAMYGSQVNIRRLRHTTHLVEMTHSIYHSEPEWSVARGSSTMVWRSYYTPTFIGLTCLSASSTNCVWWCADARTALLHSIWRYIGHQSLRPHHDSIFVQLPAINWQCRHIGRPHTVVRRLLSLVRRCGTHCQNVYVIPLLVLLFLPVFWKHSSSQSTSVSSALEALAMMRYINLSFTLHYITADRPVKQELKVVVFSNWATGAM